MNLTDQDRKFLRMVKVSADDQRPDGSALEAAFDALREAYERLDDESARAHQAEREQRRRANRWRSAAIGLGIVAAAALAALCFVLGVCA